MKLLFENWRKYLKEERYSGATYIDPSSVKVVSPFLYYLASGDPSGRLFVVAAWDMPATGKTLKFGFYSSSATSDRSDREAGGWVPARGIRDDTGWVMKLEGKFAHQHSILGQVGAALTRLYPREWQLKAMGPHRRASNRRERQWEKAGMDWESARKKSQLIKTQEVNDMFKEHGVHDILPEDPETGVQLNEEWK